MEDPLHFTDMENAALIILDMQNDSIDFHPDHMKIVPNIIRLAESFREKGMPVIHCLTVYEGKHSVPVKDQLNNRFFFLRGTEGAEEIPELKNHDDYYIEKNKYSPFSSLEFNELLRKFDVETVVITGVLTHCCIFITALEAYQNNYDVIVVEDGVDTYREQLHKDLLKYFDNSVGEVVSAGFLANYLN